MGIFLRNGGGLISHRRSSNFTKKRKLLFFSLFSVLLVVATGAILLATRHSHAESSNTSEPENLLYNVIKNEAETGGLAAKYTGAHNDTLAGAGPKDIYYFTTPIENDTTQGKQLLDKWNVVFAGKCWQMIRTTDTGGIKLLYNGNSTSSATCSMPYGGIINKTWISNASTPSLANAGYMYNVQYPDKYGAPASGTLAGNGVAYSNGVYTLIDTDVYIDNTHHYSCNNGTGTCETVRYYHRSDWYIELSGGKTIEQAIHDMLYADNVNTNNSAIKTVVDNWYRNNLTGYTAFLEDAVYCNDRSPKNTNSGGWNPNGTWSYFTFTGITNDYSCTNLTDQFSVENTKAKLTYPIGLATASEMSMINNNTARDTGEPYWSMSPSHYTVPNVRYVSVASLNPGGAMTNDWATHLAGYYSLLGVRPVISLRPGTTYDGGTGTAADPYIIVPKYNITTSAVNGTITESTTVAYGASKNIYYRPNEGYRIKSLTVDGVGIDVSVETNRLYSLSNIQKDYIINVVFEEIPKQNLTIKKETDINTSDQFNYKVRAFDYGCVYFEEYIYSQGDDGSTHNITVRLTDATTKINGRLIDAASGHRRSVWGESKTRDSDDFEKALDMWNYLNGLQRTIDLNINGKNINEYKWYSAGGYGEWYSDDGYWYENPNGWRSPSLVCGAEGNEGVSSLLYRKPYDLSSFFGQPDENGYYSFSLPQNGTKTLQLPQGYEYEIIEENKTGWTLTSKTNDHGVIGDSDITSTFVNSKSSYGLEISNFVKGDLANTSKDFTYKIKVTKDGGSGDLVDLSNFEGFTSNNDGSYTFTLKHRNIKQLTTLPAGSKIEIEEVDYAPDGYETSYKVGQTSTNGRRYTINSLGSDISIAFTNTKAAPPPTGLTVSTKAWPALGAIAVAVTSLGGVVLIAQRLRQSK